LIFEKSKEYSLIDKNDKKWKFTNYQDFTTYNEHTTYSTYRTPSDTIFVPEVSNQEMGLIIDVSQLHCLVLPADLSITRIIFSKECKYSICHT